MAFGRRTESIPLVQVQQNENDGHQLATTVHKLVYLGHRDKLQAFLAQYKGDLHELVDSDGYTLLHMATFSGPCDDLRVGKDSMRKCVAIELLDYAVGRGQVAELLSAADGLGNTPLHHAALYKRFDLVHLFLRRGANPRSKRATDGLTPIHLLADGGNGRPIKNLLVDMLKVDIAGPDPQHNEDLVLETGLIAGTNGGERIVTYLALHEGLDLLKQGPDGYSVAHTCVSGKREFSVEFWTNLLRKSRNLVSGNEAGDTLLHIAVRVSNEHALDQILKNKVQFHGQCLNKKGETPFHCLLHEINASSVQCLQLLLKIWRWQVIPSTQRADISAKDNLGRTLISRACHLKATELVKSILAHKFDDLPYPWIDDESLCVIYKTVPSVLVPLLDDQIHLQDGYVSSNFRILLGMNEDKGSRHWSRTDSYLLHSSVESRREECRQILSHPLVMHFVYHKFYRFRHLAFIWLALQALLTIWFNGLALLIHDPLEANRIKETFFIGLIAAPLVLIFAVKEIAEMLAMGRTYLRSPLNYLQIIYIISCICLAINVVTYPSFRNGEWYIVLTASGSFLSFFLLLREMGHIHGAGWFYQVLIRVTKTSAWLLLCYLPCLLAFTFAFRILLKENDKFHLPYGFSKILSMTIGELDYEQINGAEKLTIFVQALYLLFVFLSAIVLFNLLIAYTYADLQSLLQDAELSRMTHELEIAHSYETLVRFLALVLPALKHSYGVGATDITVTAAGLDSAVLGKINDIIHSKISKPGMCKC